MSEPSSELARYFYDLCTAFTEIGAVGTAVNHVDLSVDDVRRIASLLTADDERIAREGRQARYDAIPDALYDHTNAMMDALTCWGTALQNRQPLEELDRLEAAYRSAIGADAATRPI